MEGAIIDFNRRITDELTGGLFFTRGRRDKNESEITLFEGREMIILKLKAFKPICFFCKGGVDHGKKSQL